MEFIIELTGTAPLLLHNSRLANPLDPAAKALKRVTSKRNKTDDDHEDMARLEHAGSLYIDIDAGPYVPSDHIWRSLYDGAKKSKRGPKVKEGLIIATEVNPLDYPGPRDIDGLWKDENFRFMASAKVGTQRVMRCRPIFHEWVTRAEGVFDPTVLDFVEVVQIAETAGQLVGIGDWRPRFGRYTVKVWTKS